jgi:hypothetical protein
MNYYSPETSPLHLIDKCLLIYILIISLAKLTLLLVRNLCKILKDLKIFRGNDGSGHGGHGPKLGFGPKTSKAWKSHRKSTRDRHFHCNSSLIIVCGGDLTLRLFILKVPLIRYYIVSNLSVFQAIVTRLTNISSCHPHSLSRPRRRRPLILSSYPPRATLKISPKLLELQKHGLRKGIRRVCSCMRSLQRVFLEETRGRFCILRRFLFL